MSPADLAFSFFSCPYPPNPLPRRGRGSPRLFHARGFAPCIPGAEPGRRGLNLRWRCPAGGLPSGTPEQGAKPTPAGARRFCSPDFPAISKFFCPYPPDPLPLRGRGRFLFSYARGFAPCIPRAESGRRGLNLRWRCPAGGLPSGAPEQGAKPTPAGARRFCSPDFPSVSKFFCPIPRPPSPKGKGEVFSFLMQGASPLASPGLNPGGAG